MFLHHLLGGGQGMRQNTLGNTTLRIAGRLIQQLACMAVATDIQSIFFKRSGFHDWLQPTQSNNTFLPSRLAQAEIVRIAAIKAVELAQEAVKLEAAGVAAALITTAAEEAAKAI